MFFNNFQDYKLIVMKISKCGVLEGGIERMALLWPYAAPDADAGLLHPTCPAVSCGSATVLFSRKNIYEMLELCVKRVESLREQRMLILSAMSQSSH